MRPLREHATTIIVAAVVAAATAGGPALAAAVAEAINADTVDGKHAVGASASVSDRRGKLVATNSNGLLPNNIIAKAPDANRLDGIDATGFLRANARAADSDKLDGLNSTRFQRRFARIKVVSPVGTPLQNGTALRQALGAIPTSGTALPSKTAPWLLLVEPGTYNLGTTGLRMKAWVDLRGAGMNMTTITCACAGEEDVWTAWTIRAGDNTHISDISITNTGQPVATAVSAEEADVVLSHVRMLMSGPTATYGVVSRTAGGARIVDSDIFVHGTTVGIGLHTSNTGVIHMVNSRISALNFSAWNSSGAIRIATSEVFGPTSGAVTCVFSYGQSYTPLGSACD